MYKLDNKRLCIKNTDKIIGWWKEHQLWINRVVEDTDQYYFYCRPADSDIERIISLNRYPHTDLDGDVVYQLSSPDTRACTVTAGWFTDVNNAVTQIAMELKHSKSFQGLKNPI